jgi:hypothetical protein
MENKYFDKAFDLWQKIYSPAIKEEDSEFIDMDVLQRLFMSFGRPSSEEIYDKMEGSGFTLSIRSNEFDQNAFGYYVKRCS